MLAAAQVIDAVAARITGLPLTADRVHTSRAWPLGDNDLPAWRVVAEDEDIEAQTVHRPTVQQHTLLVDMHGYAAAVANLDDSLHALAESALAAVFADPPPDDTLAALTTRVLLELAQITRELSKEGEAILGVVTLRLRAQFQTTSDAPGTII